MKKVLIFAIIMAFYMCFSVCEAHWADAVCNDFKENGYITESMDFSSLNADITKGEVAQIVNLYYSFEEEIESASKSLEVANEKGYMQNASESETLKREEIAPIICELIGKNDVDVFEEVETVFEDDEDISSWTKGYIKILCDSNIVEGFPSHKFMPQANLRKGEFITMLSRITGAGGKDDLILIEDEEDEEEPDLKIKVLKVFDEELIDEDIEDELVLQSGDKALIAVYSTYEDSAFIFDIENEEVAEFIEEFNQIKAKSSGETLATVKLDEIEDVKKEFKIVVE